MSWHRFRIEDSAKALKVSTDLQEAFFVLLAAAGAPKDAAIFSRFESEDGSTEYFFSTKAMEIAGPLAQRFNASPCEAPVHKGTALLIGDQRALELLEA